MSLFNPTQKQLNVINGIVDRVAINPSNFDGSHHHLMMTLEGDVNQTVYTLRYWPGSFKQQLLLLRTGDKVELEVEVGTQVIANISAPAIAKLKMPGK